MQQLMLVIEASTADGSVAVLRDGAIAASLEFSSLDAATGERTEALAPAIALCAERAGIAIADLRAIVCGSGPGGFTSLRSAAAIAKGICLSTGASLYAVSSLLLLALGVDDSQERFVAALPAGRGEWFAADVARHEHRIVLGVTTLVTEPALREHASALGASIAGPRCELEARPRAASAVAELESILVTGAVELDSWEPSYGRLAEAQVKWEAAHGRPLVA